MRVSDYSNPIPHAVEVWQCANGYIVRTPYQFNRGEHQPVEASFVFESMAALQDWLAKHFTHRGVCE
jgi:hypothetical protein